MEQQGVPSGGSDPGDEEPRSVYVDGELVMFGDEIDDEALDFAAVAAEPVPDDDPASWENASPGRRRGIAYFGAGLLGSLLVIVFVVAPHLIEQPIRLDGYNDGDTIDVAVGDLVAVTLADSDWDFTGLEPTSGMQRDGDEQPTGSCRLASGNHVCRTRRVRVLGPGPHRVTATCAHTCRFDADRRTWIVTLNAAA